MLNLILQQNMSNLIKTFAFCFLALVFAQSIQAQTGKISGKVIDANTGEELIGANVFLKKNPTLGISTDLDGRFMLENLPLGKDTLVITYVSYATYYQAVVIEAGKALTVNAALTDNVNEITEFVIEYKRDTRQMNTLYIEQKKNAFVGNGITADVIKKTPDNNSGEALKRVSGATLQGGKFAIIRGLNERYNLAMINNSPLPSTEPEKRAFSLDLFPSNMLEQLLIVKSGVPEYPGDWAGGVILIRTREVPEDPFFNVSIGSSYNSLTTFQPFQKTQTMQGDWMGAGHKSRALPNDFPSTLDIFGAKNTDRSILANYARLLPNNYAYSEISALPNANINVSGGRNYKIGENNRLGIVFSALYSNSRTFKPVQRSWWTIDQIRALGFTDSTYEREVRAGAMVNLTYKHGKKSKFSFKNIYNHNGEDAFTMRSGYRDAEGIYLKSYSYMYTYNRMVYSQLQGEHVFRAGAVEKEKRKKFDWAGSTLNWDLNFGNTRRNMPDYRNVEYQTQDPAENPYRLKILPQNGSEDVSRLFTDLNEQTLGASTKLEIPYEFSALVAGTVKVGVNHQSKNRTFDGRFLSYSRPSTRFDFSLLELPVDRLFNPSTFFFNDPTRNPRNGLQLDEITRPYHSYTAFSRLNAAFVQAETRLGLKHRFIYGVRYEGYRQVLSSKGQSGEDIELDTLWSNFLPSFNYVYQKSEKTNIRASYFRSLSRPDFRELAPFAFLDFQTFSILRGTPDLQVTTIDNFDLRYEIYPKAGEVISFSVFYKRLHNPIELLLDNSISLGAIGRLYRNVPLANIVGGEIDFRKQIYQDSTWGVFTLYGNLSLIRSTIDFKGDTIAEANTYSTTRPMQGQSPYIVNLGAQWESADKRWIASALVNRYGERIYNVGTTTLPDIYEKARTVLDLQVTYKVPKSGLEIKLSGQDLLAQDLIFFFDYNRNQRFNAETEKAVFQYRMPRMIGLGANYTF